MAPLLCGNAKTRWYSYTGLDDHRFVHALRVKPVSGHAAALLYENLGRMLLPTLLGNTANLRPVGAKRFRAYPSLSRRSNRFRSTGMRCSPLWRPPRSTFLRAYTRTSIQRRSKRRREGCARYCCTTSHQIVASGSIARHTLLQRWTRATCLRLYLEGLFALRSMNEFHSRVRCFPRIREYRNG